MVWFLCVLSPLPDLWLSWALMWTSFLHEDPDIAGLTPGGHDSPVNMDWYLGYSSSLSHWLVLFFLPQEELVQHCHHVLVYKYNDVWLCFSWYLYCWSSNVRDVCKMHGMIRGECGHAAASLWGRHVPNCSLAIGHRHLHVSTLEGSQYYEVATYNRAIKWSST